LVGNKADLVQDRKVTTEEARQWARENDVSVCVESSAKSGDGVEDAFQKVAEEVFRKIRDGVFDLSDKVPSSLYLILLDVSSQEDIDFSQRGSR
jgi:Ras-related protein Rab-2A